MDRGLWAGSGLSVVYTWIIHMSIGKLLTVWYIGYLDFRVNLCMDAGEHSPGPREQRHLSTLGGLQHPRLEAGCLLEYELLQPLLG